MSQYQHIQFAGLKDEAPLIDVPSLPAGGPVPRWTPETNNDEFWGPNWSDWKAPPPASHSDNASKGLNSILDAPIKEPGNTAAAKSQQKVSAKGSSRNTVHTSSSDSDSDNNDDTSTAPQTRTNRPERRLPDELDAIVLQPAPRDTTETVDRIFEYLANPPRRRRFVPDEDWGSLGTEQLSAAVERHVKLFGYLVRENSELARQARQVNEGVAGLGGEGVEVRTWAQDEHLEVTLVAERSTRELRSTSRNDLLDSLRVAKLAREHLLQINDEMKRQIEDWQKR